MQTLPPNGSGPYRGTTDAVYKNLGLLDRHKPDVVLTDGLQNVLTTTFLELAKKRGIATVATWHSPYIQDVKISIFGGDPRIPPVVDTCFTWGRIHEKWLARNGTRCKAVRTGSVVNAHYRRRPPRDGGRNRGLILQYLTPLADVKSVQAARYRTQDAPPCFDLNGAVYVWTRHALFAADDRLLGPETRLFVMPAERSLDIDTELDFKIAELLIAGLNA